jgi:GAF domain-containing protein
MSTHAPDSPEAQALERSRLASLEALALRDGRSDAALDALTRIASDHFGVPISLVSLVGEREQWFKSRQGTTLESTPREWSVCHHVVHGRQPLVFPDLREDSRFRANPLVTGEVDRLVFYAGAPLTLANGDVIGSFCAIDRVPHADWSVVDQARLADFAIVAVRIIEARALALGMLEGLSLQSR